MLTFATPEALFDRDFPGHYLRLIRKVELSLIALVPPGLGVRATLSASGVSRTVVARDSFDTVTLRREPETIAFTAPIGATGLFPLEAEGAMLLPFEGMGIDAVWQLSLPKAADPFDYQTIADVLLTVEYTALDSPDYRRHVIESLDRGFDGDRSFSLRNQFPDAWYDLNNPDSVEPADRMTAVLPLTADDFPPHIADLTITHITLFVVRDKAAEDELTITSLRHTAADQVTAAGPVARSAGSPAPAGPEPRRGGVHRLGSGRRLAAPHRGHTRRAQPLHRRHGPRPRRRLRPARHDTGPRLEVTAPLCSELRSESSCSTNTRRGLRRRR